MLYMFIITHHLSLAKIVITFLYRIGIKTATYCIFFRFLKLLKDT